MLRYCICLSLIFGFAFHNGVDAYTHILGLDPNPPKEDCRDHLANCDIDKGRGLCHLLLRWCQDTCGLCKCKDVAPDPRTCAGANADLCETQEYAFWCRKTCKKCNGLPEE